MTNTLITLFTYAFDLFLILTFFNNTLQHRKANVPGYIFYGSYCIMELLLYANETLTASLSENQSFLLTLSVSFLTSYALTFLYQSSMRHRLFSAISFQFFATLGESIFTMLMGMIRPSIFSIDEPSLFVIMNLGSKVALFLLVLLVSLFWHRKFSGQNLNYHIFILATPLVSLTVMLFTPLEDIINGHNRTFFLCLYITLSLLNMLNYWLLMKISRQEQELHRLRQMENTYDHAEKPTERQKNDFREHGYGIANIQNIVEKYHGFVKYEFGDLFSMDIIIPIIDVKKRLHPPVNHSSVRDKFM